jgi:hypothetical protein
MARDTENKAFYSVGIPKDSETYQQLLYDARESGISVAKLIALRTAYSYKMEKMLTGMSQRVTVPTNEQVEEPAEEPEEDFSQADLNADAALDAW